MNEGITYVISDILSDNIARQLEFGPRSALEIPGYKVPVKTGTTDEKKDNWTDGYTPDFVVIVWVGNNDNKPMNPYLASGITGAAPIWNRVMTYLLERNKDANTPIVQPDNVVAKNCGRGVEYFVRGTENTACSAAIVPIAIPTKKP
jgi:membrane peptidoglycan carboxypeptidase